MVKTFFFFLNILHFKRAFSSVELEGLGQLQISWPLFTRMQIKTVLALWGVGAAARLAEGWQCRGRWPARPGDLPAHAPGVTGLRRNQGGGRAPPSPRPHSLSTDPEEKRVILNQDEFTLLGTSTIPFVSFRGSVHFWKNYFFSKILRYFPIRSAL